MKTWFNGDSENKIKLGGNKRRGTLSDELNKADRIGKQLRHNKEELSHLEELDQKQQAGKEPKEKSKKGPIQLMSPFPMKRKQREAEGKIDSVELMQLSEIAPIKPIQMSSPFPPRRTEVVEAAEPEYNHSETSSEEYSSEYEGNYDEQYTSLYGEAYEEYVVHKTENDGMVLIEDNTVEVLSNHNQDNKDEISGAFAIIEQVTQEARAEQVVSQVYEECLTQEEGILDVANEVLQTVEETKQEVTNAQVPLKANITISFDKNHTMAFNMNIGSIIMILNNSGDQFDFKITNDGEDGQNLNITAPTKTLYQILALFE